MPRIFDNIAISLLPALQDTLRLSERADFCVGYFNLRGWKRLDSFIESWRGGDGSCCRLLVGMQRLPHDELRTALSLARGDEGIDQQTALRLKKRMAEEFREQLTRRTYQRGRGGSAPPKRANQGQESCGEALFASPPARQAIPAAPH